MYVLLREMGRYLAMEGIYGSLFVFVGYLVGWLAVQLLPLIWSVGTVQYV